MLYHVVNTSTVSHPDERKKNPFDLVATPQSIFDSYSETSHLKRFLSMISNERNNEIIRKDIALINLSVANYWQWGFPNLSINAQYQGELFDVLLYLSMIKSGDKDRDAVIHNEARSRTKHLAQTFPHFKPFQALNSVLQWQAEQQEQLRRLRYQNHLQVLGRLCLSKIYQSLKKEFKLIESEYAPLQEEEESGLGLISSSL